MTEGQVADISVAQHVIDKCGGAKRVAEWLGVHETIVYKWRYNRGQAAAGRVPAKYQRPILEAARSNDIDLTPEDFFVDMPEFAE